MLVKRNRKGQIIGNHNHRYRHNYRDRHNHHHSFPCFNQYILPHLQCFHYSLQNLKLHAQVLHQFVLESDDSEQTLPPIEYLLL